MTILWQHDPFHNEWDFMCSVYSSVRNYLEETNTKQEKKLTLQYWLHFAVPVMGVLGRHNYLSTLGWDIRKIKGCTDLVRINHPLFKKNLQPMNGLCLFTRCIQGGLKVANQDLVIAKLSDPSYDMIWFNKRHHYQQRQAIPTDSTELDVSALFPSNHGVAAETDGVNNLDLSHWMQQGDFGTESGYSGQFETLLGSMLEDGNATSNDPYNMALAMDAPMMGK